MVPPLPREDGRCVVALAGPTAHAGAPTRARQRPPTLVAWRAWGGFTWT